MEVWNHLVFDLLIPLRLSDHATRHGDAEIERVLRKYWLPFLNEAGSHKIVKSLVPRYAAVSRTSPSYRR